MAYARKLTRKEIEAAGFTEITEDGRVFKYGIEITPHQTRKGSPNSYLAINIYDLDENGQPIKIPRRYIPKRCKKEIDSYVYKYRTIGLHRAMWAWHYGEVPDGMVVDHINNQHTGISDYALSNLQLITPEENVSKEKDNWYQYEMPCKLSRPRSYYEDKLNHFIELYEQAKKDHDAKAAHTIRSNISQYRAKLRYYDAHGAERQALSKAKKEEATQREYKHSRATQIKRFRMELKILHEQYNECKKAHGAGHPDAVAAKAKWKHGIMITNEWIENHPAIKKGEV